MNRIYKHQAVDALVESVEDLELEDIKCLLKGLMRNKYSSMSTKELTENYNDIVDPKSPVVIISPEQQFTYRINAIKLVKEVTGMPLKDCVNLVRSLAEFI